MSDEKISHHLVSLRRFPCFINGMIATVLIGGRAVELDLSEADRPDGIIELPAGISLSDFHSLVYIAKTRGGFVKSDLVSS